MKIYDCSIFLDESMMFEVRLELLDKYVDKFVVVESLFTHAGNKKKKFFDINKYPNYKNKIDYILLENEPVDLHIIKNETSDVYKRLNSLKRIKQQYNALSDGIINADKNDLIILSDIDEIPNLDSINENIKNDILIFKQKLYYFKFNLLYENFEWFGSKGCKKKLLKNFEWLRYVKNKKYNIFRLDALFSKYKCNNVKIIDNGGWHFSKIKNEKDIFYLLSNYGEHNEFENSGLKESDYKKFIEEGILPYDHKVEKTSSVERKFSKRVKLKVTQEGLPNILLNNYDKYKKWFQ